jgi:hypothetical protein
MARFWPINQCLLKFLALISHFSFLAKLFISLRSLYVLNNQSISILEWLTLLLLTKISICYEQINQWTYSRALLSFSLRSLYVLYNQSMYLLEFLSLLFLLLSQIVLYLSTISVVLTNQSINQSIISTYLSALLSSFSFLARLCTTSDQISRLQWAPHQEGLV